MECKKLSGLNFTKFIESRTERLDVLCIQKMWLKPNMDFVLYGFVAVRQDRTEVGGGGCATFM